MALELNDPSNPGVFIHRGEKVVVMPMFVQGEDKGTPPTKAEQPAATAETPADPQADATAESPPSAEDEAAPSDVEQDEGPPPPEQAATEEKPKRSRKRKAKTTE
ncbi:MAG: hypothetical protein Q8O76_04100 [Chloroflexota bacterium]|nr:hypothetical protein [Chloroflexota bacterium]